MEAEYMIPSNKVPGCLSTVYVHASRVASDPEKIMFAGESDSQLTKGLVTLLVNGLSGHTNEEIERVDAKFIQYAGIGASLTPGRNNGFLNMLGVMKHKARQLAAAQIEVDGAAASGGSQSTASAGKTRMHSALEHKLSLLQPTRLIVENVSPQHAGHAAVQGVSSKETHFNVHIVAPCFAGLSRVQRHQMVYTVLAAEMKSGLHALSITARDPSEL
jgi:sulfur transfer protein SufE/stress-induced morphogen